MSGPSRTTRTTMYPEAAPGWMIGERHRRVLDLGSGTGTFADLVQQGGHEVFTIDLDPDAVALLPERLGTRRHVAGRVESLPYLSCHFDVATASQNLHLFAPGLALSEIARVLKPGGHLAVAYNTRDDTVPWVRRLSALLQRVDPSAMLGDYGADSVQSIIDSPYFGTPERRNFRNWVPITRSQLITMVARRPATVQLEAGAREQLLAEVGELYDNSARPPEPLLLPFQASCWRAVVDHAGLTLDDDDLDAVEIRI